jgi:hypothetical protein
MHRTSKMPLVYLFTVATLHIFAVIPSSAEGLALLVEMHIGAG